jgi:hypothetical protein
VVFDVFTKVDVSALADFTKVDFGGGDVFDVQELVNLAGFIVELSFDGSTVHGELAASGTTSTRAWRSHQRAAVWLRRQAGAGGAAALVHVYASRAP